MLTINDKNRFINDGPFFEKYRDITPNVTRFERTDSDGDIIESWERGDDGRMHETTERDKLREEIIAAQEQIAKLEGKNDEWKESTLSCAQR